MPAAAAAAAGAHAAEAGHPLFEEEQQKVAAAVSVVEVSTRYSRKKQVLATLCATMGCFLNGGVIGYTGPANPSLMDPKGTDIYGNSFFVSFQAISWITSILPVGAFFGALLAGFIMERIGRKRFLQFVTSGTFLLSYVLIFFTAHISMLFAGRFFSGVGMGFQLAGCTVYIVEIATIDMRGMLGCFVQLMGCVGIVYTFCVGAVLDWKYLALANGLWAPIFTFCMCFAPESPRWLILKGREYSAMRSLEWLRGKDARDAVEKEIEIIKRDIAHSKRQHVSARELLAYWRPFTVALMMMFVFNFSGINVLIYYTINIFMFARTSIDPRVGCIVIGFTLLLSSLCAIIGVAKFNRKSLLVVSIIGMAVSMMVLGWCMEKNEYLNAKIKLRVHQEADGLQAEGLIPANATQKEMEAYFADQEDFPPYLGWLPVVAVIAFLFLGNGGYGTLVWVVTAELLPPKVRSAANGICICFGFLAAFVVAKTFVDLIGALGNSGTFYLYSGFCFAGFIFTLIFVPETKNRSQEQIQADLNKGLLQCFTDALCCCRGEHSVK